MTIKAQTGPAVAPAQRVRPRPLGPLDSLSLTPQRLAALAAACLLIDDARLYGLIESGPEIDRTRCAEILDDLARQGVTPGPEEVEAAALSLMAELGVVRP